MPGARVLREGDLVKVDVTAELDGYVADACASIPVGTVRPRDGAAPRRRRGGAGARLPRDAGARLRESGGRRARGEARGLLGPPRAARPRRRARDPRTARVPSFDAPWANQRLTEGRSSRSSRSSAPGARDVVDDARRLDDPHRRRRPLGARRAHDRDHERRAARDHRVLSSPARSASPARSPTRRAPGPAEVAGAGERPDPDQDGRDLGEGEPLWPSPWWRRRPPWRTVVAARGRRLRGRSRSSVARSPRVRAA